ncbi:hypothetical protein [uncultured Propionivibrio sp.]|nr:hypothetical protein [uncultured Propionivibrio sp.]
MAQAISFLENPEIILHPLLFELNGILSKPSGAAPPRTIAHRHRRRKA